jgi:hypothetical protein
VRCAVDGTARGQPFCGCCTSVGSSTAVADVVDWTGSGRRFVRVRCELSSSS